MTPVKPEFLSREYELHLPDNTLVISDYVAMKSTIDLATRLNKEFDSHSSPRFYTPYVAGYDTLSSGQRQQFASQRLSDTILAMSRANAVYLHRAEVMREGRRRSVPHNIGITAEMGFVLGTALASERVTDIFIDAIPEDSIFEELTIKKCGKRIVEVGGDIERIPAWVHSVSGETYRKRMN